MDAALGWIGELVHYLAQVVPRLAHVRITEQAVCFTRGEASVLDPGMHIWWPVWSQLDTYPVVAAVMVTEQIIVKKGEKTIVADAVIRYEIEDLYKFAVENYDATDDLADIAMAALRKAVLASADEKIESNLADIDRRLTSETQKLMRDFGVNVKSVRLRTCAEGNVLIHAGGGLVEMEAGE